MKRRFFSVISIPHAPGRRSGVRGLSVLILFILFWGGVIWIGILSHRRFSKRISRSVVESLENETAFLEREVLEFQEEVDLLGKRMSSVDRLEGRVRSVAGFDKGEHTRPAESEYLSEREDVSSRIDRLTTEAEIQRGALDSILTKLAADKDLPERIPSIPPVGGWVVREYGYGEDPFTGRIRFHPGVDIAAPKGTPICAPAHGKVIFAGLKRDLGLLVILDHGYGYKTYYCHCGFLKVRPGAVVRRGDVIATVGRTGRATGPHLHYEVRVDGEPVDPQVFLLVELPSFSEFFSSANRGSGE